MTISWQLRAMRSLGLCREGWERVRICVNKGFCYRGTAVGTVLVFKTSSSWLCGMKRKSKTSILWESLPVVVASAAPLCEMTNSLVTVTEGAASPSPSPSAPAPAPPSLEQDCAIAIPCGRNWRGKEGTEEEVAGSADVCKGRSSSVAMSMA